jgi:hypothetical protein
MVPNPFIEFAQDPVGVLAWAGYALVLVALFVVGARTVLRGFPTLYIQWQKNRHSDKWWSVGDMPYGVIPPARWTTLFILYITVLVVLVWTAGALLWLLGV